MMVNGDVTAAEVALSVQVPPGLSPFNKLFKSITPTEVHTDGNGVTCVPAVSEASTLKVMFASSAVLEQPVVVVIVLKVSV